MLGMEFKVVLDQVSMGGLENTKWATSEVSSACSQSNRNCSLLEATIYEQAPLISRLEATTAGLKTQAANHRCECHH